MILLNVLLESLRFAWHALVSNKLRAFLSLLGISIGIFAIVSVFTIVDSLETSIRSSVESLGNNVVYVQKWPWIFDDNTPWWRYMNRPVPKMSEADELRRLSSSVEAVNFAANSEGLTAKYRGYSVDNVEMMGVSIDYDRVKKLELKEGRYFTAYEIAAGRNMAIIGYDLAKGLFPFSDPVNELVSVKGRKVQVIGVFKKEGQSIFGSSDNLILIPAKFMARLVDIRNDRRAYGYLMVKAKHGVTTAELKDELRGIMRSIRRQSPRDEDSFSLNESGLLAGAMDALFSLLGKAGWFIGIFSILVGGFGIANIMYVSVKERTGLIGIQKSLGAKNYFILLQFLTESVMLCVSGGIVGLVLVYLCTFVTSSLFDMKVTLSLYNVGFAISFSGLIGIISGFLPAYGASRMDPVEAIRTT